MKATSIPAHETSFATTGQDSQSKQFNLTNITINTNPTGILQLVDCKCE